MASSRLVSRYALAALGAVVLASCAAIGSAKAQDYAAIVASPDRSDADRQTDNRRNPEKMMAFTGVKSGMKVMDLVSSGGYSAELLARSVGPTGVLYAQDSQETAERTKERFAPRLEKFKNMVR